MAKHPVGKSKAPQAVRDREELFAVAYVAAGFDPSKAAEAAGFKVGCGVDVSNRPHVRARINALVAEKKAALHLTADEVLADLAAAMRFDRRRLFRADGTPRPVHELTAEEARQVDGFEVDEVRVGGKAKVRTTKLKVERHLATREQAMKHLGLFPRDEGPRDPDEQARLVRERLGDIRKLQGLKEGRG